MNSIFGFNIITEKNTIANSAVIGINTINTKIVIAIVNIIPANLIPPTVA